MNYCILETKSTQMENSDEFELFRKLFGKIGPDIITTTAPLPSFRITKYERKVCKILKTPLSPLLFKYYKLQL